MKNNKSHWNSYKELYISSVLISLFTLGLIIKLKKRSSKRANKS